MNSKSWFFAIAIGISVVVCSCGGSESGRESESGSAALAMAGGSPGIASIMGPIPYLQAYEMARNFRGETIDGSTINPMVWTDIASMRSMLDNFDSLGMDHVKIYFGVKQDSVCMDETREVRRYLTVFFEGATQNGGNCERGVCDTCHLAEDTRIEEVLPYNLAVPCPPPSCAGFSRYFNNELSKDKDRISSSFQLRREPLKK